MQLAQVVMRMVTETAIMVTETIRMGQMSQIRGMDPVDRMVERMEPLMMKMVMVKAEMVTEMPEKHRLLQDRAQAEHRLPDQRQHQQQLLQDQQEDHK